MNAEGNKLHVHEGQRQAQETPVEKIGCYVKIMGYIWGVGASVPRMWTHMALPNKSKKSGTKLSYWDFAKNADSKKLG